MVDIMELHFKDPDSRTSPPPISVGRQAVRERSGTCSEDSEDDEIDELGEHYGHTLYSTGRENDLCMNI